MQKMFITVFSVFLILSYCSLDSNHDEEIIEFPEQTTLIGQARGNTKNLDIEGGFHFLLSQIDTDGNNDVIFAVLGGEAYRSVVDEQGKGISFSADAYDSVKIEFPESKRIVITSRLHEATGTSRFWDELLRFEGILGEEGIWSGSWKCYPLDTKDDTIGTVDGLWIIETF